MDLFKKYIPLLENVIKDSKISKNKINELVLVGGLPAFQKYNKWLKNYSMEKKQTKVLILMKPLNMMLLQKLFMTNFKMKILKK